MSDRFRPHLAALGWIALWCSLAFGCGTSSAQLKLTAEHADLKQELAEVKQYNADLKFRLQLAAARNKLLTDLVQGLTIDPDHFAPQPDKLASADASLQSLDRDVEALVASFRHSRDDAEALRAQRESLQNELVQARHTIETARASQAEIDARTLALQRILAPLSELIRGGRINVSIIYGRFSIEVPEAALFVQRQTSLTEDGKSLLERIVTGLRTAPDRKFRIAGPADPVDKRGASQREMTLTRSVAVLDFLVDRGVVAENAVTTEHDARPANQPRAGTERVFAISLLPHAEELPRLPSTEELLQPQPPAAAAGS